jgi:hypothetical protein
MSHQNQIVTKGMEQSSGARSLPVPVSRIPISIRPATMDDLPFIDGLQKENTKQVGFMPTRQFEGKIAAGHVLIAEERHEGTEVIVRGDREVTRDEGVMEAMRSGVNSLSPSIPGPHSVPPCLRASVPVGYLIGKDQYFRHDDVGIIYQINIAQSHRRSLVGAMLLKAQFERSAYGCKLYCCWCAQDIEANRFWEAMGFVPLAFRAGSAKKSRVHIFWQKRIREGDVTTPWWFPSQTSGGSIREDRIVFPIPPGKHWSDEMPRILPQEKKKPTTKPLVVRRERRPALGGWVFTPPVPEKPAVAARQPREKLKNNPKLIAAARELRDRWIERANEDPSMLVSNAKYSVARALNAPTADVQRVKQIAA